MAGHSGRSRERPTEQGTPVPYLGFIPTTPLDAFEPVERYFNLFTESIRAILVPALGNVDIGESRICHRGIIVPTRPPTSSEVPLVQSMQQNRECLIELAHEVTRANRQHVIHSALKNEGPRAIR